MVIVCQHCGNIVGDVSEKTVTIKVAVRGRNKRTYQVPSIDSIICDFCGRTGMPVARMIYDLNHDQFDFVQELNAIDQRRRKALRSAA